MGVAGYEFSIFCSSKVNFFYQILFDLIILHDELTKLEQMIDLLFEVNLHKNRYE
jgi:hypothetical protein